MKNRISPAAVRRCERIITRFGRASLVGLPDGSLELRGGNPHDQTSAKEWISLFMHEAVPRFAK